MNGTRITIMNRQHELVASNSLGGSCRCCSARDQRRRRRRCR